MRAAAKKAPASSKMGRFFSSKTNFAHCQYAALDLIIYGFRLDGSVEQGANAAFHGAQDGGPACKAMGSVNNLRPGRGAVLQV